MTKSRHPSSYTQTCIQSVCVCILILSCFTLVTSFQPSSRTQLQQHSFQSSIENRQNEKYIQLSSSSAPVSLSSMPYKTSIHHRTQLYMNTIDTSSSTSSSTPTSTPNMKPKEIVILGGGFGGINTALTLTSLPWPEGMKPKITLLDNKERFIFLPLLYELCVGSAELEEVAPTFQSLLSGTGIDFVQCEIQGIDVDNSLVYTSSTSSNTVSYDSLVVATGVPDIDLSSIPGLDTYGLPFYTIDDCFILRKKLALLEAQREGRSDPVQIVIVGGSYSGVELAMNLAERFEEGAAPVKITMVHRGDTILPYAQEHNRKVSMDRLKKEGVEILTECTVAKAEPSPSMDGSDDQCQVILESNNQEELQTLPADLLIWTAGAVSSNVPKSILNSKLPRDAKGRIVTGSLLRVKDQSNIFALGDCSRAKKEPYDSTAQVAMQQAPVVAWNTYATLMNDMKQEEKERSTTGSMKYVDDIELLPFSYLDLGEMMSLGRDDATISSLGGLVELDGSLASNLRRLIYVARSPSPVASARSWLAGNIGSALAPKTTKKI